VRLTPGVKILNALHTITVHQRTVINQILCWDK